MFLFCVFLGQAYSFNASSLLELLLVLNESAIEYKVSLNVTMCGLYTDHDGCQEVIVFMDLPVQKFSCLEDKRRRKREVNIE